MYMRLAPLALATFAVGTDNFVIAGLLPHIASDLHIGVATAGQLVTAFALTFALSASIIGAATSGLDRRLSLLLALSVFVAGNIATAVGPNYAAVLGARIVTAVGGGLITSAASSTAAALAPSERRAWAMAVVLGGLSAATALGLPLGTLVGQTDWRITLWMTAGLGLTAIAGVIVALPPVRLPVSSLHARLVPLRQPWVAAVLLTTTLAFAGTYLVYTYIAPAVHGVTAGSVPQLTIILFAFGLGSVIGTLTSGRLTDRHSAMAVLLVNLTVSIIVLMVSQWAWIGTAATVTWAVIWGICAASSTIPQQHRLVERSPASAAILLGLNSSSVYIGISLGGGLGGMLLKWVAPNQLGLPAALLTAAALALALATGNPPRPAHAMDPPLRGGRRLPG